MHSINANTNDELSDGHPRWDLPKLTIVHRRTIVQAVVPYEKAAQDDGPGDLITTRRMS